ncbi:MAG: helix-turn-helix domain-containing protein [Deltaproteobacteria bacterium]|jgi:transposase-like protein|nr:helix-turn-helix domain-containing protein [Deltaproteobacteria bacterium]
MLPLSRYACPNPACSAHGQAGAGNIAVRGRYGRQKDKYIIYCRICGKRFLPTIGTPLFGSHLEKEQIQNIARLKAQGLSGRAIALRLGFSKSTVHATLKRMTAHIEKATGDLAESLGLGVDALRDFWVAVSPRAASSAPKPPRARPKKKRARKNSAGKNVPGGGQEDGEAGDPSASAPPAL